MKTKKVNRYYCDFCSKASCSASHMSRHERSCTANPNRECGLCKLHRQLIGPLPERSVSDLIAILPDPLSRSCDDYMEYEGWLSRAVDAATVELKEAAGGCPACVLAALRQAGVAASSSFRFQDEKKSFLRKLSDADLQRQMGY